MTRRQQSQRKSLSQSWDKEVTEKGSEKKKPEKGSTTANKTEPNPKERGLEFVPGGESAQKGYECS